MRGAVGCSFPPPSTGLVRQKNKGSCAFCLLLIKRCPPTALFRVRVPTGRPKGGARAPFFLAPSCFCADAVRRGVHAERRRKGSHATIKLHIAAKAKFSFAVQSAAATEWRHTPCCLKPLKLLGIYAKPSLHSAGKIFAQLPFKAAEHRRACKACFFCRRQSNLCAKPCILVRRRLSALCRGRRARRQSKSRENSRLFVFRFGRLF